MSRPLQNLCLTLFLLLPGTAVFSQNAEPPRTDAPQQQAPVEPPKAEPAPPSPASVPEPGYLLQGVGNYREGNYEEAFDDLTRARTKDPGSAVAAYYLGATLKKMQRISEAISQLKDATMLQPAVKQAFLELADAYYAANRMDEALFALEVSEREGLEPGQTAFLKGLVLMKKRTYPEALASFEKAKSHDQKLAPAVDFQIATIYNRLGRQTEARDLFRNVADQDPGLDMGQMARQQADALTGQLEKTHTFTASVNVQEQYDSNVLLKPDDASAASDISGASDTSTILSLQAEYARAIKAPFGLKFQYSAYMSSYQKLKAYDIQSHTVGAIPSYRLGENSVSLPLTFNYTLVDNSGYIQAITLAPAYSFVTGDSQYAQASIKYQKKDYLQDPVFPEENRDATNVGAGLSWSRLIAREKGFVTVTYELNKEKTEGVNWSYLGHKAGANALYPVTDRARLAFGLEVYRQGFDNVHTVFGEKRTDTTAMGSAQLLYALTQKIDAQLQYVTTKAASTIPVYGYHKNMISAGVYARF